MAVSLEKWALLPQDARFQGFFKKLKKICPKGDKKCLPSKMPLSPVTARLEGAFPLYRENCGELKESQQNQGF